MARGLYLFLVHGWRGDLHWRRVLIRLHRPARAEVSGPGKSSWTWVPTSGASDLPTTSRSEGGWGLRWSWCVWDGCDWSNAKSAGTDRPRRLNDGHGLSIRDRWNSEELWVDLPMPGLTPDYDLPSDNPSRSEIVRKKWRILTSKSLCQYRNLSNLKQFKSRTKMAKFHTKLVQNSQTWEHIYIQINKRRKRLNILNIGLCTFCADNSADNWVTWCSLVYWCTNARAHYRAD